MDGIISPESPDFRGSVFGPQSSYRPSHWPHESCPVQARDPVVQGLTVALLRLKPEVRVGRSGESAGRVRVMAPG